MVDKPQNYDEPITRQPTESAHPDSVSLNPYAPAAIVEPEQEGTDAELTRRKYLAHEVSVQSIGNLFIIASVVIFLIAGAGFLRAIDEGFVQEHLVGALISSVLGCLCLGCGISVRKLQPPARWAAVPASLAMLFFIPLGTILGLYFLYLLLSRKGAVVFSEPYAEVRAATPHIRYRTPVRLWAMLVLFILGIVLVVTLVLS